jgi:CheY-like chemotaxis protein
MEVHEFSVFVRVRDEGRGIPGGALRHVFEAFHRGDSGGGSGRMGPGGLGLGLAIAKYIVQEHHGSIHIESPGRDRGTTVTVQLPLAEPMAAALTGNGSRRTEGNGPLSGMRLLLVEDDADTREALTELLAAEGAEVRPVPSASAGLAALKEFAPHVIISDIGMPDEDGYAFLRKVRELKDPIAAVPAIALTAYGRAEDTEAAIAAGYQRHMPKPPEPGALTDAVLEVAASRT